MQLIKEDVHSTSRRGRILNVENHPDSSRNWRSALTVIIRVEFGFELLHLPLVSQQQCSIFLQRPHSILLLVFRHLLDEGVLLIVGDSWKERNLAR